MSRPKPNILLSEFDNEGRGIEVCSADAVYAVCYQDRPINIKSHQNRDAGYPPPKYVKTSFVNSAHAFNLAERLNQRFNTQDFSVKILDSGRTLNN
jgi:hypothetical protein